MPPPPMRGPPSLTVAVEPSGAALFIGTPFITGEMEYVVLNLVGLGMAALLVRRVTVSREKAQAAALRQTASPFPAANAISLHHGNLPASLAVTPVTFLTRVLTGIRTSLVCVFGYRPDAGRTSPSVDTQAER